MEGVIEVPKVKLNSGHEMPVLAMGTAFPSLPDQDELVSSLIHAIEIGYRHFDTAAAYGSEEALGRAVAAAIQRGLVSGRDQLFITSKLWITETDRDLVLPALKRSLGRLGLDYVDLYLVHWPLRMKDAKESLVVTTENIIPFDMKGTWEGMEECHKLGLAKSIGVSNFTSTKISKLLQNATIPPAVNQVEMSVAWQQGGLLKFCGEKGIHVSAWSPLGNLGAGFWGSHGILEIPLLQDIAQAKHKTIAQVALRWVYQKGASVIVKSFNKERMKENLHIFDDDCELNDEEMVKIQQLPQCRGFKGEVFVHSNGPYKSVEELWDGDI
ncbi:methylecgonone reductase-like isoform X1 [Ipomoea triloba]|uniref:methylecgonone reductase-like isoform X1 n=1 Tax=Ipomoea triloba TaxID=35885 RepID=UPI00125CECC5|nr:methylecgonone reductase-like isoform X1 [Ipomoea triloba]